MKKYYCGIDVATGDDSVVFTDVLWKNDKYYHLKTRRYNVKKFNTIIKDKMKSYGEAKFNIEKQDCCRLRDSLGVKHLQELLKHL